MRRAPFVLVLCGAIGLAVVAFAALSHLDAARRSVERRVRSETTQALREEGYRLARDLLAALATAPVARFDKDGALVRPAPPAHAQRFESPTGSITVLYLERDPERALRHAVNSAERALAKLHLARRDRSARHLQDALAEKSLRGTELALQARLEGFRWEDNAPDEAWQDDVSALLGGPQDRFARALLRHANVAPGTPRHERERLVRMRPREGLFVESRVLMRGIKRDAGWEVRSLPLPERLQEEGVMRAALPDPLEFLELRGTLDRALLRRMLRDENRSVVLMYAGAAVFLLIGIGYALLALRRANRLAVAKQDFLANVTHELKTPLANVRLYAESLQQGRVAASDQKEFLATILEETGRLDGLVEGLLHVARGPSLHFAPLDCQALLVETASRWEPRLARAGFTLALDAPALPTVRGDKEALQRALSNLLDNSRKYARDNPRIELTGAASNGSVRLTVRDHGPGIPVAHREEVLRPFARLESADRKETEGVGLGLSLVVACMEAHGGRVEWGGGGGAAVTLVLPVDEGTNAERKVGDESDSARGG